MTLKFTRMYGIMGTYFSGKMARLRQMIGRDTPGEWCNPPTLQLERLSGAASIPGRALPLERDDEGLRTQLALAYFCDPSACAKNHNFTQSPFERTRLSGFHGNDFDHGKC